MIPSSEPIFPQFTLLHGPRPACLAFSKNLTTRHPDILTLDFELPLLDCIYDLFFPNDRLGIKLNLNHPASWLTPLPFPNPSNHSIETFLALQKSQLRESLSRDILGRILLQRYLADGWEDTSPSVLIRDFDEPADLNPILARYGRSTHTTINLGPLTDKFPLPPGHVMWIGAKDPEEQVNHFIIELQQRQQRGVA